MLSVSYSSVALELRWDEFVILHLAVAMVEPKNRA